LHPLLTAVALAKAVFNNIAYDVVLNGIGTGAFLTITGRPKAKPPIG
jgi:hypothetical protein